MDCKRTWKRGEDQERVVRERHIDANGIAVIPGRKIKDQRSRELWAKKCFGRVWKKRAA